MNETKVSDADLSNIIRGHGETWIGSDRVVFSVGVTEVTAQSMARELLAHRASRPLEQAAMKLAEAEVASHRRVLGGYCVRPDEFMALTRARREARERFLALDAAAKQAGGGATAGSLSYIVSWRCRCGATGDGRGDDMRAHFAACPTAQSINAPAPSPAPSSPPREDAMTPEDESDIQWKSMSVDEWIAFAARRLGVPDYSWTEKSIRAKFRAAVAAEGARKDALLGQALAQRDAAEAEVARLGNECARMASAQPAAGGEAARKLEAGCRVLLRDALVQFDIGGPLAQEEYAERIIDALLPYLDARSSARAGG